MLCIIVKGDQKEFLEKLFLEKKDAARTRDFIHKNFYPSVKENIPCVVLKVV